MRKIIFILFIFITLFASAQDVSQGRQVEQLSRLATLYNEGKLDDVIDEAKLVIGSMNDANKAQAYRFLAHAYIMNDQQSLAEDAVKALLNYDFNYGVQADDDLHFIRMIEKFRVRTLQISSASLTSESLSELPVPVTIIDAEMIKRSGARNIKEVLLTFVPGLSDYEGSYDANIASRLVGSPGQENILFLLNGHRINEKSTNKAVPDYSISIDKIESIEVLRGPASAIYGNAALMHVVNIKTKSGSSLQGADVAVTMGSHGAFKGSVLIGVNRSEIDVAFWANVFKSKGEEYPFEDGSHAYINRYMHKPTYDFGGSFKWKGFEVLFNVNYGNKAHTTSTFLLDAGSGYTYDKWPKYNSSGVGTAHNDYLIGMAYTKKIGNLTLSANASYTSKTIQLYTTPGDKYLVEFDSVSYVFPNFFVFNWREEGVNARLAVAYEHKNAWGDMLVMGGLNADFMSLRDGSQIYGFGEPSITTEDGVQEAAVFPDPIMNIGSENAFSPFFQFKQKFGSHWLINCGLGYDLRHMHGDTLSHSLSPRASLIYIKDDKFNVKFNYGKAFISAPYYYRANMLNDYLILEGNLESETIDSFQLNSYLKFSKKWSLNAVIYYNALHNIITSEAIEKTLVYSSKTSMKNIGLEIDMKYDTKEKDRMMFNFQMTLQRSITRDGISYDRINNIPNIIANLVFGYKVLDKKHQSLWLTTNSRFVGAQDLGNGENLSAHLLFNAGICYNYRILEMSLNGYNIPNYRYFHGGGTTVPQPQEGRSILGTLRVKF